MKSLNKKDIIVRRFHKKKKLFRTKYFLLTNFSISFSSRIFRKSFCSLNESNTTSIY